MIKIFLSDDDPFFLSLEKEMVERIIADNKLSAKLGGAARSGAELLRLPNIDSDSLLFMDIDYGVNQPNGIDITAALKKHGSKAKIVYTTNHSELAMKVLKSGTEPFGFLEKNCDVKKLSDSLDRYIRMALRLSAQEHENNPTRGIICLKTGVGEQAELCMQDILYLESEKTISHGITYHTDNGSVITVISTLDHETQRLDDGFVRVHRSFLANQAHMIGMRGGYIVMSDQSEIPCSLKMRSEIKKWLKKT
ncbi:MAG: response regulator transcription factor [Clostridiales bacterium]|nr:response regulator transcription factor [Clostridiales bacterium]